ncbi:MAG: hypothetical protein Q9219_001456 [cf. Caloplaca sp. 3 TL-2023]
MSSPPENSSPNAGVNLAPSSDVPEEEPQPSLSKNMLKKLRRDQAWEAGREKRKELRKLKKKEKRQQKKRAAHHVEPPLELSSAKRPADDSVYHPEAKKPKYPRNTQLPIAFVIDCGFDDLMLDGERKSLASQVTRSYSDNHRAPYRSHLFISSFGGHLKDRFDNVLSGHHRSWKGVKFLEADFQEAANEADRVMKSDRGGELAGALGGPLSSQQSEDKKQSGEVVYLTSDSPDTLTELKPYSTYIVGGLVDKNRHKGICYKRAMDQGIKTAKLPIGDYMKMASRFVLATNHVVDIMLRWLELGDWSKAFLQVIPKRKGGVLKDGLVVLDETPRARKDDSEVDIDHAVHG